MSALKAPPSPKWQFGKLLSDAELAELVGHDTELARLREHLATFSTVRIRAEREAARAAQNGNPSVENLQRLERAMAATDDLNTNVTKAKRLLFMRTEAKRMLCNHWLAVCPLLRKIYERALLKLNEEIEKQKEREKAWAEIYAEFDLWCNYYSGEKGALPTPSISLARRALDLHRRISRVEAEPNRLSGIPDSLIESWLTPIGQSLGKIS